MLTDSRENVIFSARTFNIIQFIVISIISLEQGETLKFPTSNQNFSQNVTEPSKRISYPVGDLFRCFTKLTGPCAYTLHIVIRYPQQMVQMAFCYLWHTFHKQFTNVSQHGFVILLWGIMMSPLTKNEAF